MISLSSLKRGLRIGKSQAWSEALRKKILRWRSFAVYSIVSPSSWSHWWCHRRQNVFISKSSFRVPHAFRASDFPFLKPLFSGFIQLLIFSMTIVYGLVGIVLAYLQERPWWWYTLKRLSSLFFFSSMPSNHWWHLWYLTWVFRAVLVMLTKPRWSGDKSRSSGVKIDWCFSWKPNM